MKNSLGLPVRRTQTGVVAHLWPKAWQRFLAAVLLNGSQKENYL
jgi:hypothetical protein